LFAGGAQAVLKLGDAVSRERAASLAQPPLWFGIDAERPPGAASATIVRHDDVLAIEANQVRVLALHVDVPGDHNRRNLAAALAAASAAGVDPALVTAAAPHFVPPPGRYERVHTPGGADVIYDAYNASPAGALATLAAFARERASRRIAVLGSMAELGPESPAMHERVGAAAAASADVVLAGGAFATSLAAGALAAGLAPGALVIYGTNDEAIAWLRAHAGPGDLVLLKGSRMYRMEQIVAGLTA
jgi:UDP-N-acetylmuramoyl-tripeptide--D-alanyl-D-alanine ligase